MTRRRPLQAVLPALGVLLVASACRIPVDVVDPSPSAGSSDAARCAGASITESLWVGDSYLERGDPQYPTLVAEAMGWYAEIDAKGGSGFIAHGPGVGAVPFIQRLPSDGVVAPDIVLVDGGRNDAIVPEEQMISAMSTYFQRLRVRWPGACLVFVLPSFITKEPPSFYPAVRAFATDDLRALGVRVIDPVDSGWYTTPGDLAVYLDTDGVHPNQAGVRYIADRVTVELRSITG